TTPLVFDGGAGNNNSLTLQGGTATSDVYSPGPGTGQGTDVLAFGAAIETVHFSNLSPVVDLVAGPLTVNGTNHADSITAAADPNVAGNGLVSVNNLETLSFLNKTTLTLNGLAGND